MDFSKTLVRLAFSLAVILVYTRPADGYTTTDTGDGIVHRLEVTQDVVLESATYRNYLQFLIVGKHQQYPKKRSLLQFEDLASSCCTVVWAKMYLYFSYAHKASWQTAASSPDIMRSVQVYEVRVAWDEAQANRDYRLSGVSWNEPYGQLGVDTYSSVLDTVDFYPNRPRSYYEFDITGAVFNWKSSSHPNNGLLIMASNEEIDGRGLRFYSNANADNHAYINVMCR